nr:hypothetical protein [Tanacetum cinerariifolium]
MNLSVRTSVDYFTGASHSMIPISAKHAPLLANQKPKAPKLKPFDVTESDQRDGSGSEEGDGSGSEKEGDEDEDEKRLMRRRINKKVMKKRMKKIVMRRR